MLDHRVFAQERDGHVTSPSRLEHHVLDAAILQAIAYADVFDYPLTVQEIHRYLVGVSATLDAVRAVLDSGEAVPHWLAHRDGYFALPGREAIVETRLRRKEVAARLWPWAVHYGRLIAALPFVRMVAVTGALTMDNVEPRDDIDYLIVTETGRLWSCRALVIGLVRLAARQGNTICPNYLLSERALVFRERNLFTAHEVAQMVPLAGLQIYRRLRQLNGWTAQFLPNAHAPPRWVDPATVSQHPARSMAEIALRTRAGDWLEGWEMRRKLRKFRGQNASQSDAAFSPDWCKGHFDSHGGRILAAFTERLRAVEGWQVN